MGKYLFYISTFFVISAFADEKLILLENPEKNVLKVPVIEVVEGKHIVLVSPQHRSLLDQRNLRYTHLDDNVRSKEYYLVYPFGENPGDIVPFKKSVFEKYGTVLATFNSCLLIESTADRLNAMTEYNIQLDYLELEPREFNLNNTIVDTRGPAANNPLIEEMLERVDEDSVEQLLRDLCAFHNRDVAEQWNKEEAMPWIKQKFLDYGCDSIIELPLRSGSYGPMVAGVRFGKKDPSINQFTLIGGHPDTKISGGDGTERHQGANDNGTGTVGVLEAARVHQYYDFDYSIIYAGFNGEEVGFYGSKALVNELKRIDAKVIGGAFNYDMLGIRGSRIRYEAYNAIEGAQEFCDRINEIAETYQTYDVTATATATSSQSTDVRVFWDNGYVCAWHNWGSGGGIHSPGDSIPSNFDPAHLTGALKTGLAVTAFYAVPQEATGIQNITLKNPGRGITYTQPSAGTVIITVTGEKGGTQGILQLYDLQGRLIKAFNVVQTTSGNSKVLWNGMSDQGEMIANNSILLVHYSSNGTTFTSKLLLQ